MNLQPRRLTMTRGEPLPPGAVVVAQPSKWANVFVTGMDGDLSECLAKFELLARRWDLSELRGKDLASWEPVGAPSHAYILLRLANDWPKPSGPILGPGEYLCPCCGARQPLPPMPLPLDDFLASLRAFTATHHACAQPRSEAAA